MWKLLQCIRKAGEQVECRLELCLPDHPPASLCILIDRQDRVAQSWYRAIVSHPKWEIKTSLALIQHGEKGNVCSHLSDKLNGQPPPRSTTHVGLRLSTAETYSWRVKGLSLAECFDLQTKQHPSIRSGCESPFMSGSWRLTCTRLRITRQVDQQSSQSLSGYDWSSERSSIHGAEPKYRVSESTIHTKGWETRYGGMVRLGSAPGGDYGFYG